MYLARHEKIAHLKNRIFSLGLHYQGKEKVVFDKCWGMKDYFGSSEIPSGAFSVFNLTFQ